MHVRITLVFAMALAPVWAQDKPKDTVTVHVDRDTNIADFLDRMSEATGIPLLYDPAGQRIRNVKLGSSFKADIPKDKLFDTFRGILAFYELTLVPIGPRGYQIYLVIDSRSTNNFVKNKAMYVPFESLEQVADKDGMFISTTIPLKHVRNTTTLRTALAQMVSPAGIGRVTEVAGSRKIVVMDFAPTVAAMARMIKRIDVPPEGETIVLEKIELTHALASEVAAALGDLFEEPEKKSTASARRSPYVAIPEFAPRFRAYRNSVLVRAKERDLARIQQLIKRLDVPMRAAGVVEVVRLKKAKAPALRDTLHALITGRQVDLKAQVIDDPVTNALILAGQKDALEKLKSLIAQLDIDPT